jgi:hypothetical protein
MERAFSPRSLLDPQPSVADSDTSGKMSPGCLQVKFRSHNFMIAGPFFKYTWFGERMHHFSKMVRVIVATKSLSRSVLG